MADLVHRAVQAGRVGQLVLVAPPKTLGILRIALHKDDAMRVIGEVPGRAQNPTRKGPTNRTRRTSGVPPFWRGQPQALF